jgi:hypothetical protein
MTLKSDFIAYKQRWAAVAEVEQQEMQHLSIEEKWHQLNSLITLAIKIGIFKADLSEEVVYQRWAMLKEKTGK